MGNDKTLVLNTDFQGTQKSVSLIRDALERIARAGFSHIHWCHEWIGDYIYSFHEMIQIRQWCDELGLKVKGVHASDGARRKPFDSSKPGDVFVEDTKYYASLNECNRLSGVDLVKNRIDLAYILEAETIVLHFAQPFQVFEADLAYRDIFFRQAFKSFDELEPYCKTRGIKICIENLPETPAAHSVYMFDRLFERYDAGFMGLCLDTGHANITCKGNSLDFAERSNERLFMIHAHDNQGERDEHLIPFEGTFNWEGFARVLARSPYQMPLVIEVGYGGTDDAGPWLEKAYTAGRRLSDTVMGYRCRL